MAGPERELTPRVIGNAAFVQYDARIASDGRDFLVVWPNGGDVAATRVSSAGERIDDVPLRVAYGSESASSPDLTWGGDGYLVVWVSDGAVRGRMVRPDGSMLPPFAIQPEERGAEHPQVAFNGGVFLVTWNSFRDQKSYAAIVDRKGNVRKTAFVIEGTDVWSMPPAVAAADGTFYLVTDTDLRRKALIAAIDGEGNSRWTRVIAPTGGAVWNTYITSRGDEVIAAWNSDQSVYPPRVTGVRIRGDATESLALGIGWVRALSADFLVVGTPDGGQQALGIENDAAYVLDRSLATDAASNGSRTLVTLNAHDDIVVQTAGEEQQETLTVAARNQAAPDIATIGDVSLVVWSENIPPENRAALLASRIDSSGVSAPVELQRNINGPRRPRVVTNGSQWLVVWFDGLSTIVGMRLSLAGEKLDETPLVIAQTAQADPDVAWNGSEYVVAFTRGTSGRGSTVRSTVYAARLSPEGVPAGELMLPQGLHNSIAHVAANDEGASLVVWRQDDFSSTIAGALISRGGSVSPVAFPFAVINGPVVVGSNGSSFAVAAPAPQNEIRWFLVNGAGTVTQPLASAHPRITSSRVGVFSMQLAPLGERWLLLAYGQAVILDPRTGSASEPVQVADDLNARVSGSRLAYARAVEPAWPMLTRVFVREISLPPDPPRRRAVR